jgi:trk system potassium uptake protein TrkH
MQFIVILKTLGALLLFFSATMLPPLGIAWYYHDGAWQAFLESFCVLVVVGSALWLPFLHVKRELKARDCFLLVTLVWSGLALFGAMPFMLSTNPHLSFTNAVFESMSGLTTTGATVIADVEVLPHAIQFYRQQLQFFGGMGIVVLAVAILPILRIGGLQLYQAETPGPAKDSKLTPRITQTAKALWFIYLGLTVACTLFYWACNISFFDAISEAFATVSTGGFSIHNNSFEHHHNLAMEAIASLFMFLGALNFSLHFAALKSKSLRHYWQDSEFKAYVLFLISIILIVTIVLLAYQVYTQPQIAFIKALFNTVSISTTTGLTSAHFVDWPGFVPVLLMFTGLVGGCASSTSGGIKFVRALIIYKHGLRENKRLLHPNIISPLRLGQQALSDGLVETVRGFMAVFVMTFIFFILLLVAFGMDFESAFGATVASICNVGASIGDAFETFLNVSTPSKWVLTLAMLMGRLELFTIFILFSTEFWRK